MPYKKSPMSKSSCIKMYDEKGKPSGLMMEGSAMHMDHESPAKQTDERSGEGVTVTGDASKVGGKTTMTEAEKKREVLKKRIEKYKTEMLKDWDSLPNIFITSSEKKEGLNEIITYISSLNLKF